MLNLNYLFNDDNKTREELIENVEVTITSYTDAFTLAQLMSKTFSLPNAVEALKQFVYTDANLDNSIKLIDKRDGKIYGFLIFSDFTLDKGSPIIYLNPMLDYYLLYGNFKQINGFAFAIDKRLRGCGFDKKMLFYNLDFLKKYDFIWCGVEAELKSHSYWKRLGFTNIMSVGFGDGSPSAEFYISRTDKKPMNDIFILKALSENMFKIKNNATMQS